MVDYDYIQVVFTKRKLNEQEISTQKVYIFKSRRFMDIGEVCQSPNYSTNIQIVGKFKDLADAKCSYNGNIKELIIDSYLWHDKKFIMLDDLEELEDGEDYDPHVISGTTIDTLCDDKNNIPLPCGKVFYVEPKFESEESIVLYCIRAWQEQEDLKI